MTHVRAKIMIGTVLLLGAVGYLVWAGAQEGWVYYLEVEQLLDQPQLQGKRVRLRGQVSVQNVESNPGLLLAKFDLVATDQQHRLAVVYKGVIPDTFKPGVEVVVEGQLDAQGFFQADHMMTKCASKYQAEEHARKLEKSI